MNRIKNKEFLHSDLSRKVIGCCLEVVRELGSGFLESVYKKALCLAMCQQGLKVSTEQSFEIGFRGHKIGRYNADLIVDDLLIVELKCCRSLAPEHQAQLINYLKAANMPIGLLINFGNQKLEYRRVHHPDQSMQMEEYLH